MRLMETGVDRAVARIQAAYAAWSRETSVETMRAHWDGLFDPAPADTVVEPASCGGVPAEWVSRPDATSDRAILYLHGGGFRIGSPRSHRGLVADLAAGVGCRALCLDYRLTPEHRFPAALDDSCGAYRWLCERIAPANVAIAGDSAGAGLALATMLTLRDLGDALPAAAVLMSAWTDLTASGPSYAERAEIDPLNQRPALLAMARGYLGGANPHTPAASPLFADPTGLPPLLMQVGGREIVHSDTILFAEQARAAGVAVEFQEWADMVHVFQQFPAELPQAGEALADAARFLRRHLGLPPSLQGVSA